MYHTLEAILNRETLIVREIVVFEAAIGWAKAESRRQDICPEEPENQRKVQ